MVLSAQWVCTHRCENSRENGCSDRNWYHQRTQGTRQIGVILYACIFDPSVGRPKCTLVVDTELSIGSPTLPTLELEQLPGSKARIMQARVGFGETRKN